MIKKIISLSVSAILLMSTISSCGNKKNGDIKLSADGTFVPTEDLKIDLWYTQGTDFTPGNKISDNVVSQYLYDKTKVVVNNIYGNDGGQWDVKLSRLIAGNNMPEVIVCGAGQGPSHFKRLADAKQCWEITDEMLEKYAPNLLKRIPKETLDKFKVNGKLYGIPYQLKNNETTQAYADPETIEYINECVTVWPSDETMSLWIRDDVLKMIYPKAKSWSEIEAIADGKPMADKMFDIPITTTEQYIEFFYKIKDLDLKSLNNKKVYPFGYSGGDNWEALVYLGGDMMGYAPHYYTSSWNPKTKQIRLPLVEDIVRKAAKYQNQMILDKVIDPESLVHTNEMFKEKVLNGQYAICTISYGGGADVVNNTLKSAGANFRYRPFCVQIPNQEGYEPGYADSDWNASICFTKQLDEKDFVQMLNWLNVMATDEFEEVYWWGRPEDGLYVENADGTRKYVDERMNKKYLEGVNSALDDSETKGIGRSSQLGEWYVQIPKLTRWEPTVYNKSYRLSTVSAVTKFPADSEHVKIEKFPPYNAWDVTFADIDEVVKYWAEREKWENGFALALAAQSQDEFDAKWDRAIQNLNDIVDVKTMCKKMTEAAKNAK